MARNSNKKSTVREGGRVYRNIRISFLKKELYEKYELFLPATSLNFSLEGFSVVKYILTAATRASPVRKWKTS
jgi:hypothetical protein